MHLHRMNAACKFISLLYVNVCCLTLCIFCITEISEKIVLLLCLLPLLILVSLNIEHNAIRYKLLILCNIIAWNAIHIQ